MMKNVVLKKILKGTVFKGMTLINKFVPKRNDYILLYSANRGLTYNLVPLEKYLLDYGYNKKYKIICGIENMSYAGTNSYNHIYVSQIKSFFYFLRSKHVFYTAGQIPIKPSINQCVIFSDHGASTLKTLGSLTNINNGDENYFTYVTYPNVIYKPIVARGYSCDEDAVKINGEPMTDIMFKNYKHYDLGSFNKIILWTPTFRKSDYLGYDDSEIEELLPTFVENDYDELNSVLEKYNFKLIVKLHSMQNTGNVNSKKFSNLTIYTDKEFSEKGYSLYELMPQVDVMLGDYSSTMLQFLLLDKPLGYVVPDIENYKLKRGFVFENYKKFMPGEFIFNKNDFYTFLNKISLDLDDYKEQRMIAKNLIHKYQNGDNCKRLLELSGIR